MTFEEICSAAAKVSLDPDRLILFEPWFDKDCGAMRYRFEYRLDIGVSLDWNFLVSESNADIAELSIKYNVLKGLNNLVIMTQGRNAA
jgi:hypothetical protein